MKPKIHIIGSGVSGLTTAIALLEKEYEVKISAEKFVHDTVSAKAAAIWFPFKIEPRSKVGLWSRQTYEKFEMLSKQVSTGIKMVDFLVLIKKEEDVWWKTALPENVIRKANMEELPDQYHLGYMVNVPLIETPIYLNYLLDQFQDLGGQIEERKIEDIDSLIADDNIVINCTGLGAVELVKDELMYPIRGQIVKIDCQENIIGFGEDFASGEGLNELAYVIPRSDCIVLGGTTDIGQIDLEPNAKTTQRIVDNCLKLNKNLGPVTIQSVEVGLRPGRSKVRLEKEQDKNIIHNYGHGGGGFTVSWGCAYEVCGMIDGV